MTTAIEELLEYAVRTAGKVEKAPGRSLNYIEIARAYLEYGRKDRCAEILAEAVKIVESLKLPEERVVRFAWIAGIYAGAGEEGKSRELFTRSKNLARATGEPARLNALFDIAREYTDAGLKLEASELLAELQGLAAKIANADDKVLELVNMAEIYIDIEQSDKALGILDEAFKLAISIKDHWFGSERMLDIAGKYADIGNSEKAQEALKETAQVVNRLAAINQPYFLFKMVDVYISIKDRDRAMAILTRTLGIISQDESTYSKSGGLNEIADKYRQLGDEQRAINLISMAREPAENAENVNDKIAGFTRIAEELGMLLRFDKAIEIANQAFDLCATVGNTRTRIYLLGDLSLVYIGLKSKERAVEAVNRIIQVVSETDVRTLGLGEVAADLAKAGEYALALSLAKVIRELDVQAEALTGISQSLVDSGQEPGAEITSIIQAIS